jgi:hypothetical protein
MTLLMVARRAATMDVRNFGPIMSKRWIAYFAFMVLCMSSGLCVCLALLGGEPLASLVEARPDPYWAAASSRVQIGDDRDAAVQALSDAWYHGVCNESAEFADDLFIYGSHSPYAATMILVSSNVTEGKMRVSRIGIIDTDFFNIHRECLPSDFDKKPSLFD